MDHTPPFRLHKTPCPHNNSRFTKNVAGSEVIDDVEAKTRHANRRLPEAWTQGNPGNMTI